MKARIFLESKLRTPSPPKQLVPRDSLQQRLSPEARRRTVLIHGPAGSGKTTLASTWARSRKRDVAWVTLDTFDNEPARFAVYLLAALRDVAGGEAVGWVSDQLLGGVSVSVFPQPFVAALSHDLTRLDMHITLVMDNYDLINARAIHQVVEQLIENHPTNLQLVLISRTLPPLPLARWRLRGWLHEIGPPDLRFSHEETASFLRQMSVTTPDRDSVAALLARTEGWIGGIHLSALPWVRRPQHDDVLPLLYGAQRDVDDYLVEEVLLQQSMEVQQFLLQTACLDQLTAPLCDALTGSQNGWEMLDRLERHNLFLIPLDQEGRWYRYHRLFARALRGYLERTQPERRRRLCRRAATWFAANEMVPEAIDMAFAADDQAYAANLLAQIAEETLHGGHFGLLINWMDRLPTSLLEQNAWLSVLKAFLLLSTGSQKEANVWVCRAQESLEKDAPYYNLAKAYIPVVHSTLAASAHHLADTVNWCQIALERLSPEHRALRALITWNLAYAFWQSGDVREAERKFRRAAAQAQADNLILTVSVLVEHAQMCFSIGRLRQAARLCERALRLGEPLGPDICPRLKSVHAELGTVYLEQYRLEEAESHLQRVIDIKSPLDFNRAELKSHLSLARLHLLQGDPVAVQKALSDAHHIVEDASLPPHERDKVAVAQIRFWIRQGAFARARTHLRDLERQGTPIPLQTTRALLALAQEKPENALSFVQSVSAKDTGENGRHEVELLVLKAVALRQCNRSAEAIAVLWQALELGEEEGYVSVFLEVEGGSKVAALLRREALAGRRSSYRAKVRAAFAKAVIPDGATVLTEREQQVLALVAAGLTNQQIADELVIALNTAKKHVSNILGKLDARNRTDAVATARERQLI